MFAIFAYVYLVGGGNWGHYQNWKLLSYFMPYFLVILFCALAEHKSVGKKILIVILINSLSSPLISWLPILKGQVPSNVLTRSQVHVKRNFGSNLTEAENLNVQMKTWFETMAMANILENRHIFLVSPSYLPVLEANPDYCTLENSTALDSSNSRVAQSYRLNFITKKRCN
jgi:hypothetical protein